MCKSYLGKENIASNGMKMRVIKEYKKKDTSIKLLDVEFEDGYIKKGTFVSQFNEGRVKNPNFTIKDFRNKNKYLGQTKELLDGDVITVIDYKNSDHILVKHKDGREEVITEKFLKSNKKLLKECISKYVGYSKRMRNAQVATIIAYRSYEDIDIQFEDGTVVEHISKRLFDYNRVGNPNYDAKKEKSRKKYLGKIKKNKNGDRMKIIKYNHSSDIDVEFIDEEKVVKNTTIIKWNEGRVYLDGNRPINKEYIKARDTWLGVVKENTSGDKMKLIEYGGSKDISVEFDDGSIICHRTLDAFRRGLIRKAS